MDYLKFKLQLCSSLTVKKNTVKHPVFSPKTLSPVSLSRSLDIDRFVPSCSAEKVRLTSGCFVFCGLISESGLHQPGVNTWYWRRRRSSEGSVRLQPSYVTLAVHVRRLCVWERDYARLGLKLVNLVLKGTREDNQFACWHQRVYLVPVMQGTLLD